MYLSLVSDNGIGVSMDSVSWMMTFIINHRRIYSAGKGVAMGDEYLKRDQDGIMILDGHRKGGDRRAPVDRRTDSSDIYGVHERRNYPSRRDLAERRMGPAFSVIDLFYEHLSAFILGFFLILLSIFMMISGLTFLPVIGLFAGIVTLIIGGGLVLRAFSSRWPTA